MHIHRNIIVYLNIFPTSLNSLDNDKQDRDAGKEGSGGKKKGADTIWIS